MLVSLFAYFTFYLWGIYFYFISSLTIKPISLEFFSPMLTQMLCPKALAPFYFKYTCVTFYYSLSSGLFYYWLKLFHSHVISEGLLPITSKNNRDGTNPGYTQWMKVFNLQNAVRTLMFLQEHGINSYDEICERTTTSGGFSNVSERIKPVKKICFTHIYKPCT